MSDRTSDALSRFARDVDAGAVVFRDGDAGDEMFVIQSGQVRISKKIAQGERVIAVLGAGEFFGEMAILNGRPRNATATVTEDGPAHLLAIDSRRFEQMIAHNREITLRLIKKLAARLDSADSLIEILMERDPRARVMRAIARHAESFGEAIASGQRVAIGVTDLAALVNVDVATTEQVVARLQRVRIVSIEPDGHAMILHDVDRLLDFLEFLEMPQRFAHEGGAQ
ncbi:MAG: Crp/Fnr family transcriptional regulator [Polyangiales bacterium]